MLRADATACDPASLGPAADWLRAGGVVVFPTDTFYGLAADPTQAAAVQCIFDIKGRDAAMALPLVAASREQVDAWCGDLGPAAARLAAAFWPGPLSLILPAPAAVDRRVHGGMGTVAVRVPAHAVARALCAAAGSPLTATSANRSGQPPAASAAQAGDLLRDPRVFVVDAGTTPGGAPSTIVDVRGPSPVLVRAGAIAWSRVLESLQE